MTFTQRIKQEILNSKFSTKEVKPLLLGILAAGGVVHQEDLTIQIKNSIVFEKIVTLIKRNLKTINSLKVGINSFSINKAEFCISKIILEPNRAFLTGLFIGGGSVSDSQSSAYHLEILVHNSDIAKLISPFLDQYEMNFKQINRRQTNLFYLKKSDDVATFLLTIHSYGAVMEFEDFRIKRDFQNSLNRISNLEVYNQKKVATAAFKQLELIKSLRDKKLLSQLSPKNLVFIKIREQNKLASLNEIIFLMERKYQIIITKSALNHFIRKMNFLNNHFPK